MTQKGNFGYPDKAILVWKVKKSDKRQFYCKALLEAISQYMRTLIPEIKSTPVRDYQAYFCCTTLAISILRKRRANDN